MVIRGIVASEAIDSIFGNFSGHAPKVAKNGHVVVRGIVASEAIDRGQATAAVTLNGAVAVGVWLARHGTTRR